MRVRAIWMRNLSSRREGAGFLGYWRKASA